MSEPAREGALPGQRFAVTHEYPGVRSTGVQFHLPANGRFAPNSSIAHPPGRRAVFLDRDGVLGEEIGHIREPESLKVLPGVAEALRRLQDRFYLMVVTNQSGIARGFLGEDDLLDVHRVLVRSLAAEGAILDGIYYCPHHPTLGAAPFKTICQCRKPSPGMLLRAAKDWDIDLSHSFMVGDNLTDMEAAYSAGVNGILVGGASVPDREWTVTANDLLEAAEIISSATPHGENIDSEDPVPVRSSERGLA